MTRKYPLEHLGPLHLFSWIVLFELGSAVVIPIGTEVKQATWIVILLGCLLGLVYMGTVYGTLYRMFPDTPLTGYVRTIAGNVPGWLIGFAYLLYFVYIASRNTRDFGDLLAAASYDSTPLPALNLFMVIAVGYVVYSGLEVFGRTAFVFFLFTGAIFIVILLLVVFSDMSEFGRMLPVFGDGWKPVWKALFPTNLTFPFGEMVVFTMLLPHMHKKFKAARIGMGAMALSALLLCLVTFVDISVLGVEIASRATFPLFTSLSRLRLAEFVQRMDAVVLLLLVITSFFKIGAFMFAAILAARDLFRTDNYKTLVMPVGLVVFCSSLVMAGSLTEHLEEGLKVVPLYVHLPFQFGLPALLLLTAVLRGHRVRSASSRT